MIGLQIKQVGFSYLNGSVLSNINLTIKAGEMVGLLGPNGSGKTTLLKLASGILPPGQGEIWLDGHRTTQWRRQEMARNIAVVPQHFHIPFAFTVNEVVALGRIPFARPFAGETRQDKQVIAHAMQITGIQELASRRFDELSGGERQKVILAMALAQQPRLLLLDEPTVHLDITHQIEILELVRELNAEQKITIVTAIHDLNLASLYFDRLILLKEGQIKADGTPAQVLTAASIKEVFSASVSVAPHPVTGTPHIVVTPRGNGDKKQ